jgi:hypothetical protein
MRDRPTLRLVARMVDIMFGLLPRAALP